MSATAASNVPATSRPRIFLAALAIAVATVLAYWGTWHAPFVFDDAPAIADNPTIRDLGALGTVLAPPATATGAGGRPLVNLSLALNYAVGGLAPESYHAVNLVLHIAAALTLFGIVRRACLLPALWPRRGANAFWFAAAVALIWSVHPLQSESVICVIQRSEVLVGVFYLLTLYAFLRSFDSARAGAWRAIAVASCALGMASKELMATAPLVVWLLDRTFIAGSFPAALRQRKSFYAALATTWLIVGWLALGSAQRGGVAGFGLGMSAWEYLLTQCRALVLYGKLALWPHPLVLDYGIATVRGLAEVWWQALVVLALLGWTIAAIVRARPAGAIAGAGFLILAPSSSFVPLTTQTIAEHRMYLPLAGVAIAAVVLFSRLTLRNGFYLVVIAALACGTLTWRRGRDYRDELHLWQDTVAKNPGNARAHNNLGGILYRRGQLASAMNEFQRAVALRDDYADAHANLALGLHDRGQWDAALAESRRAVEIQPDSLVANLRHADALLALGQASEALKFYAHAEQLDRAAFDLDAQAPHSLAVALERAGRIDDAIQAYRRALQLHPESVEAHNNFGLLRSRRGENAAALAELSAATRLAPQRADVLYNYAIVLGNSGRLDEAISVYERAIAQRDDFPAARMNLGAIFQHLRRLAEARAQFEAVLARHPDSLGALVQLAETLREAGDVEAARARYAEARKLKPDLPLPPGF